MTTKGHRENSGGEVMEIFCILIVVGDTPCMHLSKLAEVYTKKRNGREIPQHKQTIESITILHASDIILSDIENKISTLNTLKKSQRNKIK